MQIASEEQTMIAAEVVKEAGRQEKDDTSNATNGSGSMQPRSSRNRNAATFHFFIMFELAYMY